MCLSREPRLSFFLDSMIAQASDARIQLWFFFLSKLLFYFPLTFAHQLYTLMVLNLFFFSSQEELQIVRMLHLGDTMQRIKKSELKKQRNNSIAWDSNVSNKKNSILFFFSPLDFSRDKETKKPFFQKFSGENFCIISKSIFAVGFAETRDRI